MALWRLNVNPAAPLTQAQRSKLALFTPSEAFRPRYISALDQVQLYSQMVKRYAGVYTKLALGMGKQASYYCSNTIVDAFHAVVCRQLSLNTYTPPEVIRELKSYLEVHQLKLT